MPGGLAVRIRHTHHLGPGSIPSQGTEIPLQAATPHGHPRSEAGHGGCCSGSGEMGQMCPRAGPHLLAGLYIFLAAQALAPSGPGQSGGTCASPGPSHPLITSGHCEGPEKECHPPPHHSLCACWCPGAPRPGGKPPGHHTWCSRWGLILLFPHMVHFPFFFLVVQGLSCGSLAP